jgi:localization factor PodJL
MPPQSAFEEPPPFAEDNPFDPAQGFADEAFSAAPAPGDSYLSAARRSARAAASAADTESVSRGFAWGSVKPEESESAGGRTRTMLVAFGVLIVVALIAGIVLSQGFPGQSSHSSGLGALFAPKQQSVPQPQAGTPLHALSPQSDDGAESTSSAAPKVDTTPLAPLQQKSVAAAPVHTIPPGAKNPAQTASIPALDRLTQLANGGNSKAELIVGLKYLNGDGVPVNEVQAAKWLERSAESGEPVAQYRLGTLYEHGKGVAQDSAKATHWYQAAAMQGNRKAMHNLAVAFAEGTGVKKDPSEAARWFSKAAALGLADSQFNLAVLYERGQGVPQSLLDAYKWYAVAAASGDAESKSRIEALATQLSADDRAAAQHAADTFRAVPTDPHANLVPQQGDLPPG